ncbi:MAG: hypothetical protein WCS60_11080, partial [Hydrogenophaga sp.]
MNAPDKLQQLLSLTREPFPQSRKIYVPGGQAGVQVPMREIALTNGETVTVYDTSGPYTDPQAAIDIRRGLPAVRSDWIAARGDTETYTGRQRVALDDGGKKGETTDGRIEALRAEAAALQRAPRRARAGANVTQMHYARRGIVTPEMEYIAIRENGKREWMREYLGDAEREARLRQCHVLADGDVLHLRRDDAAPGVVHLAHVRARLRPARLALQFEAQR